MPQKILVFVLLSLLVSACSDPHAELAPREALLQAHEATAAGDAGTALGLLKSAANRGDVYALETLAVAHDRGYLQAQPEGQTVNLPIRTWPWSAKRWRRAFEAELDHRVETGDRDGLHVRAHHLMSGQFVDREWIDAPETDRAEGRAILTRLADDGDTSAMERLGLEAMPDREAARPWFEMAIEAGSAQGCWLQFYMVDQVMAADQTELETAAGLATAIDRAEACRNLETDADRRHGDLAVDAIRKLQQDVDSDSPGALARRDSLTALGVFERHPRLMDL